MNEVLETHHSDGLISLSSGAEIETLDEESRRILNADLGLCVSNGRLRSTSKHQASNDEALKTFLRRAAVSADPFVVQVQPGLLLVLHQHKIPHALLPAQENGNVVMRIAVVNLNASIDSSMFGNAFNLTPAEQSVVAALTNASNASSAARQLGLSRETVKTHLRNIYGKTGASSLTQLMLLIGKLFNR